MEKEKGRTRRGSPGFDSQDGVPGKQILRILAIAIWPIFREFSQEMIKKSPNN
jgi:hypothetical protein